MILVAESTVCAHQCPGNRTHSPRNLAQFGRRSNTGPLICVLPSPRTHFWSAIVPTTPPSLRQFRLYGIETIWALVVWEMEGNTMTSSNENFFRVAGPLCGEFHWSPVNSPHNNQWHGALMFSLICAWTNGWVNNCDAGDLRRLRSHYDVTVMVYQALTVIVSVWWVCEMNDTQQICTR